MEGTEEWPEAAILGCVIPPNGPLLADPGDYHSDYMGGKTDFKSAGVVSTVSHRAKPAPHGPLSIVF